MSKETQNFSIQAGCFYFDPQGELISLPRPDAGNRIIHMDSSMSYEARVERLDFRTVTPENDNQPPEVLMVGGLHADEEEVPGLAIEVMANLPFGRVEAWNTHILASMLGMREAVVPIKAEETLTERQIAWMKNGRKTEKNNDSIAGKKIDLNRQFNLLGDEKDFDEVMRRLDYPEAKMLMSLMRNNSSIKTVFSFHEDPEFGADDNPDIKPERKTRGGFYFYDMAANAGNDQEKEMVAKLAKRLVEELSKRNFKIHHGLDDPDDPDLGCWSEDGLIYQPNINEKGERVFDNTFESAVIELGKGRLELNNVERAFAFEVPKALSRERKVEMLEVIRDNFIRPYLEMSMGKADTHG